MKIRPRGTYATRPLRVTPATLAELTRTRPAALVSALLARHAAPGLVAALGLMACPAATALGQTAGCAGTAPDCTIDPGSYSSSFSYIYTGTTPFTVTNNGAFSVTDPASDILGYYTVWLRGKGTNAGSANGNGLPGGAGAALTVQQTPGSAPPAASIVTSPFTAYTQWFYAALAESWGGNGGPASSSGNGGAGAPGGGVSFTNASPITVSGGPIGYGGSALEVHGIGGSGGNVSTTCADGNSSTCVDGNGNPKYDGGIGGAAAGGNAVSLTNANPIQAGNSTAYLVGSAGYRGLAALSMGGNGGLGSAGVQGGSGGPVTVTDSAPVSVYWTWSGAAPADPFASAFPAPQPPGVWGILASSISGNGTQSVTSRVDGGNAGSSGVVNVSVNSGGSITIGTAGATNAPGAGIGAFSTGGTGGAGYDKSVGGTGGAVPSTSTTPAIAVNVTSAGIDVSGEQMSGIVAMAKGGTGGSGGKGQDNSDGADGGSVGSHATQGVTVALSNATVSTTGTSGAGILAAVTGGVAGDGTDYENELATGTTGQACRSTSGFARSGCGGGGGNTSAVNVSLAGTSGVSTTGTASPGIIAVTQGGAGGTGGTLTAIEGTVGSGGSGGQGASVTVTLNSGASVTTTGGIGAQADAASYGVFASSRGGAGGTGGEAAHGIVSNSGDGGPGGGAYDVTVSVASGAGVTTSGQNAAAIVAQSLSGSGGAGGEVFGGVVGNAGSGGAGGNTGNVEVDNNGTLRTVGDGAQGVLAQTMSGTGGAGGTGNGIFYASGGAGGSAGTVNGATVRNAGTITTAGAAAHGILAQAIGGGGGDAGKSTGDVATVGGSGALAADGGFAVFTQTGGAVTTTGPAAIAVLAQAIGGGGGDGGNASGVIGTVGGTAGGGGAGGIALAQVTGGTLATSGAQAHGLVLQSIGGGGGNAGNATSASSLVAVTIGGTGGSGGAGNTVEASFTGGITLQGTGAAGLVAQSIGGGGGTGGSAYAVSGGIVVDESMALGGTGGGGGGGGALTVALSGAAIQTGQFVQPTTPTNLLPVDAYGVVVQSIGGGGGLGGSSSANAVAVGIPLPSELNDYSYALSQSVGGSGGNGGAGGTVQAGMANGSSITTQGQGSHGLVAQSIGRGGGTAGDSSALAATLSYGRAATASTSNSFSADVAFAAGGGGGGGGDAGQVSVWIGGGPGGQQGKGTITTYGDYADGVLAHSIGGGGGNAGYGSTTTVDFGATRNLQIGVGVGGFGGVGGNGCTTTPTGGCTTTAVTIYKQSSITTFGASAMGIVAQSVGGGGGTSQGGTIDLGAAYTAGDGKTITPSGSLTAQWGGTGAAAGKGGPVSVSVQGAVRTHGGDATAVLAQSIGGGGGVGGSAGAEASADNPVSTLTGVREFISEVGETNLNWSAVSASVSLGGTGGAGGAGGEVDVTHSGQITTKGDWAQGIVAQSIGGGGGKGGTAVSDSSGSSLSLSFSVGGSGGAGGSGGPANVTLSGGTIATGTPAGNPFPGFGAFGVLAQSVGGGGGVGVDGSANATGVLRLGGGWGGGSGGSGGGGDVTVKTSAAGSMITTQAEQAHAVVLQSIGGGGGVAGSGNASASSGLFKPLMDVSVGGTDGYSGDGGSVSFDSNAASVQIETRGTNAFGILAQSIGGGGGLAMASANAATTVSRLGGNSSSGVGGLVSVQFGSGSLIDTTGFGAHGIVAQSIGGGGGIAALPAPTASPSTTFSHVSSTSSGGTGNLTVGVAGSVWTHGPGAHGVVAQMQGGGGGMSVLGGQTLLQGSSSYYNGQLTVSVAGTGSIRTDGSGSTGIVAQASLGNPNGGTTGIDVEVYGTVQGGSGSGKGVWVDSGLHNAVNVYPGGSVTALSGQAICCGSLAVGNQALIVGTIDTTGMVTNAATGTWTLPAAMTSTAANVVSSGTLVIAGEGRIGDATLAGNFTQTASGTLVIDADFNGRQADRLTVKGDAVLDGQVRPVYRNVLPRVGLPVLAVEGNVSGSVKAAPSSLYGFGLSRSGNAFLLAAESANFAPVGFGLDPNQAAVARHVQSAWDHGGSVELGALFGLLGNDADASPAAYAADLRQLSPQATFAPGAQGLASVQGFATRALSCPKFEGTTAMLVEGECTWLRVTALSGEQSNDNGIVDFDIDSTVYQMGGQVEFRPGWFVGGSAAYADDRLKSTDRQSRADGSNGYGALTLKHQTGPWLFAGSAFGGGGSFDTTRNITLPGYAAQASGNPDTSSFGLLLRGAYTIGHEAFYVRPSLDLGAIHVRSGGYRERGAGALALDVDAASQTTWIATPMVEIGGRVSLNERLELRPYVSVGVSFLSNDAWTQRARFAAAPPGAGSLTTTIPHDRTIGRVSAGLQLYTRDAFDLRLQYDGEFSDSRTTHGGSLVASFRF